MDSAGSEIESCDEHSVLLDSIRRDAETAQEHMERHVTNDIERSGMRAC